jgi:hypothetical protein
MQILHKDTSANCSQADEAAGGRRDLAVRDPTPRQYHRDGVVHGLLGALSVCARFKSKFQLVQRCSVGAGRVLFPAQDHP